MAKRIALALLTGLVILPACSSPASTPIASPTPAASADIEALARAVVQISPIDSAGDPCWSGSGTIIDADGTILTNHHVIENDSSCDYDYLLVSATTVSDRAPEPLYRAAVYATDEGLDLAVLRITGYAEGGAVDEPLPFIPVGDSDAVGLGDPIIVLGYPGTGGDTITYTDGAVSGFLDSAEAPGERGWIKTQTTISGGNSGGAAVSAASELIGVPTQVSAGDDVSAVDCRRLEDTNGDGEVDADDNCIPIGGFLNGLRPVNLAVPLIRAAASAEEITPEELLPEDSADEAPDASVFNIAFGSDVEDDVLVGQARAFPSGTERVCASFEYDGWVDGTTYDLVWLYEGETDYDASFFGQTWSGGTSGEWWVCASNGDEPLADGMWELVVYHGSEDALRSESVFVGDEYQVVPIDVVNGTDRTICYLLVSPSASGQWGQDELGAREVIEPSESTTLDVPAVPHDFWATDCDDETVAKVFDVPVGEQDTLVLEE